MWGPNEFNAKTAGWGPSAGSVNTRRQRAPGSPDLHLLPLTPPRANRHGRESAEEALRETRDEPQRGHTQRGRGASQEAMAIGCWLMGHQGVKGGVKQELELGLQFSLQGEKRVS